MVCGSPSFWTLLCCSSFPNPGLKLGIAPGGGTQGDEAQEGLPAWNLRVRSAQPTDFAQGLAKCREADFFSLFLSLSLASYQPGVLRNFFSDFQV